MTRDVLAEVAAGKRRVAPEALLELLTPPRPAPAKSACGNDPVSVGVNAERVAAGGVRVEPRPVLFARLRRWVNERRLLAAARRAPEPRASVVVGGRAAYVPREEVI